MSLTVARHTSSSLERFGVAVVTVLGLLSLGVALHIDERDGRSSVVANR